MTDKPTDEALENLFVEETGFDIDDFPAAIFDFARAALAKWGQPAQATNGRKVFVCTHCDGVYADQPVTQCDCLPDENTFTEGWICFGAPAQAAEPVAREPLTNEQIRAMLNKHPPEAVCEWSYRMGIDDAELHHGIKGGQP